jgi:hypothetical protein
MADNYTNYCFAQLSRGTSGDHQFSGKQLVNEIVISSITDDEQITAATFDDDPTIEDYDNKTQGVFLLYRDDSNMFDLNIDQGTLISDHTINGTTYSIYRKEDSDNIKQFTPVAAKISDGSLIDYNISNQRDYIYVAFPSGENPDAEDVTVYGHVKNSTTPETEADVVSTQWDEWSIAELIPAQLPLTAPNIKKRYIVDYNNVWLFKYDFQGGEQTQNIMFTEHDTLGRFSRMSHGKKNTISSSVSCYLGSEIICTSKLVDSITDNGTTRDIYGASTIQYTERPNIGRLISPKKALDPNRRLTTNEAMDMLDAWRAFAYSKNLKLLTDKKGQVKIVQITSTSTSIADSIPGHPVKLSFNWTEVASTDGALITGDVYEQEK